MKETNKHTPGPWSVICAPTQIGVCWKVGPAAIIAGSHGAICLYDDYTTLNPLGSDAIEANARLIAASPDLLRGLQNLANLLEHIVKAANDSGCSFNVDAELSDAKQSIVNATAKGMG